MPNSYQRTAEELYGHASMFWPAELSRKEADLSIIPKLLETQDQFISILSVDVPNPTGLFQVVDTSKLPGNLFLKHLVVLADFGGEMLQRINSQFKSLFPKGTLTYVQDLKEYSYKFKQLPIRGVLNNDKLGISGKKLLEKQPLSALLQDVAIILLFGSTSTDEHVAEVLAKCEIGTYLGEPDKLQKFIKQRYIWVSRITGGATSNALGQSAQTFVRDYLTKNLGLKGVTFKSGTLPGITHTDAETNRGTTFDLVVAHGDKYVAIEVSFQVTTNSVIERKAGQARSRFEQIEKAGYKIAYVLDGAGNFQRQSALNTLCSFSHCTVAFSRSELDVLCQFLREYFTVGG